MDTLGIGAGKYTCNVNIPLKLNKRRAVVIRHTFVTMGRKTVIMNIRMCNMPIYLNHWKNNLVGINFFPTGPPHLASFGFDLPAFSLVFYSCFIIGLLPSYWWLLMLANTDPVGCCGCLFFGASVGRIPVFIPAVGLLLTDIGGFLFFVFFSVFRWISVPAVSIYFIWFYFRIVSPFVSVHHCRCVFLFFFLLLYDLTC